MVKQWKRSLSESDILSDGQAFKGANIDAPISSAKSIIGISESFFNTFPDDFNTVTSGGGVQKSNLDGLRLSAPTNGDQAILTAIDQSNINEFKIEISVANKSRGGDFNDIYVGAGNKTNGCAIELFTGECYIGGTQVTTINTAYPEHSTYRLEYNINDNETTFASSGTVNDSATVSNSTQGTEKHVTVDSRGDSVEMVVHHCTIEVLQ